MPQEEGNPSEDNEQVTGAQGEGSVTPPPADGDQESVESKSGVNFRKMEAAHQERLAEKDKYIKMLEGKMGSTQQPKAPEKKDLFADKDGYETPTYDDLKNVVKELDGKLSAAQQLTQSQALEQKYPNYAALINKYEHEVPSSIVRAIEKAQDLEAAVVACMKTPGYIKDNAESNMHPNAKRALDNAAKPKSTASVGATGSINKRSEIANMTRAQRVARLQKNARAG